MEGEGTETSTRPSDTSLSLNRMSGHVGRRGNGLPVHSVPSDGDGSKPFKSFQTTIVSERCVVSCVCLLIRDYVNP